MPDVATPAALRKARAGQYKPPRRTAPSDSGLTPTVSAPPMAATALFSGGAVPGLKASHWTLV